MPTHSAFIGSTTTLRVSCDSYVVCSMYYRVIVGVCPVGSGGTAGLYVYIIVYGGAVYQLVTSEKVCWGDTISILGGYY